MVGSGKHGLMLADWKPRTVPQQARSRATVDHVLSIAAGLLDEVGIDGFNTNLLAERAGVGLRAIYRYFPNKLAIFVALAERLRETERAWIDDLRAFASAVPWELAVDRSIDGYFQAAARHPGYAAMRAATQALPELQAIGEAASHALEEDLAIGLTNLGVRLEHDHLMVLCQTIIESANRILEIALRSSSGEAALLLREVKHMIRSLLGDYVPTGK